MTRQQYEKKIEYTEFECDDLFDLLMYSTYTISLEPQDENDNFRNERVFTLINDTQNDVMYSDYSSARQN